jgi:hypothetical protein
MMIRYLSIELSLGPVLDEVLWEGDEVTVATVHCLAGPHHSHTIEFLADIVPSGINRFLPR